MSTDGAKERRPIHGCPSVPVPVRGFAQRVPVYVGSLRPRVLSNYSFKMARVPWLASLLSKSLGDQSHLSANFVILGRRSFLFMGYVLL
ncbi:unnamed protein product [Clonostachys solani]|uniref:Uncharacterized protein n=1 Tax=Clonostachys solani TaxID=160281 RepID=A0A9N9Z878_9HYPO|nr:unnamed protein product [Clonostachys solani]